jgi:hypothetical protein
MRAKNSAIAVAYTVYLIAFFEERLSNLSVNVRLFKSILSVGIHVPNSELGFLSSLVFFVHKFSV